MWEGLRKWFDSDGWADLKIAAARLSACVYMCWFLLLGKDQLKRGPVTRLNINFQAVSDACNAFMNEAGPHVRGVCV